MSLAINALLAVIVGFVSILLFTGFVVLTNKTIQHSRVQMRYIRVWQLIRVVAGLTICGIVGTVVAQAFDLWLT